MAEPKNEAKQTIDSEEEILNSQEMETEVAGESAASTESSDSDRESPIDDALETALLEVEKFKDMALRAEAEMQNLQRRTAREVENAHKYGLEKFLNNLLPVVDSLEKAIEVTAGDPVGAEEDEAGTAAGKVAAIAEGVRLCHKLMIDTLAKEGVEVIDPHGQPFDPNEHQAMSMVENPDMEPNSVFAVVQKGYKLNGRLVRPAMVMVTKAASESGGSEE